MRHSQAPVQRKTAASLVCCLAWLLVSAGCGDGRIATYPVSGTVLVNGQPADGVTVIFCPTEGQPPELMRERPMGTTNGDGKYQLTTFNKNDGAPVGEYKVIAFWTDKSRSQYDERGENGGDRLGGRYMILEQTPLKATIDPAPTEVSPFELTNQ